MIRLTVARLFRGHLVAIILFGVVHLLVVAGDYGGPRPLLAFSPLFRLTDEGNLPSLFSALALAACALVAVRIAQSSALRAGEARGWRLLAGVFGFVALDEATQLHEVLSRFGAALGTSGPLLFAGAFPYAAVAVALAVVLHRFWFEQSRAVRRGIAVAGLLYVAAAVGLEAPENLMLDRGLGMYDLRLAPFHAAEELGEMAAAALFLRGFLLRFVELGGGPLLALVGERPIMAVAIVPESEIVDAPDPVAMEARKKR